MRCSTDSMFVNIFIENITKTLRGARKDFSFILLHPNDINAGTDSTVNFQHLYVERSLTFSCWLRSRSFDLIFNNGNSGEGRQSEKLI